MDTNRQLYDSLLQRYKEIGVAGGVGINTNSPTATFTWQTDQGAGFQNVTNGGQYLGANNDTLIVSDATMANNNQQFRCKPSLQLPHFFPFDAV